MNQDPKVLEAAELVIERAVRTAIDNAGFGAFAPENAIHGFVVQIVSDVLKAGFIVVKK